MMILSYPSKKVLREQIGQPLRYIETSMFGPKYPETEKKGTQPTNRSGSPKNEESQDLWIETVRSLSKSKSESKVE